MIGSVRTRREFATLSQAGRRTTASVLWCNWCLEPNLSQPKLALAITRAYGNAVQRNRLRRRIRSALASIDRQQTLPPVMMLVGPRRPHGEQMFEPGYRQILADLERIIAMIDSTITSSPVPSR